MIICEIVRDPFALGKNYRTEMPLQSPSVLRAYIPCDCLRDFKYYINRVRIPQSAIDTTVVRDGDHIIFLVDVHAGWGIVALAWLWVAAVYTTAYYVYKTAFPAPPPKLKAPDDSPTYTWEGVHTTCETGTPISIIYGTHRVGGNVVSAYVETVSNLQYLHMLISLGEGILTSIAGVASDRDNVTPAEIGDGGRGILINNSKISNLRDVLMHIRMGNDAQDQVPGFYDAQHSENAYSDEKLEHGIEHIKTTTASQSTNAVKLTFRYPAIFRLKEGSYENETVILGISYRPTGVGGYTPIPNLQYTANKISPSWQSTTITFPTSGVYDVKVVKISANTTTRHMRDVYWEYMDELVFAPCSYPNTALLAMRMLGTDQLSGSIPNVVTLIKGRKIPAPDLRLASDHNVQVDWENSYYDPDSSCYQKETSGVDLWWDGTALRDQYCANPIWCLRDLLTNTRFGMGDYVETQHLDFDAFVEMAAYCDALPKWVFDVSGGHHYPDAVEIAAHRRYRLDIVIDGSSKALDAIQTICRTFNCFLFWHGGMLVPYIDKPEIPSMMFTMGNIIEKSLQESFLSRKATVNCVEVSFLDEADDYRSNTIQVIDQESIGAGNAIRKASISLIGVSRQYQATMLAQRLLLSCKYTRRTISFKAATDALACLPDSGDGKAFMPGRVFNFAHDAPAWGIYSGRATGGTPNTITLNKDVTLENGYHIRVKHADDTIEDHIINSPPGVYVKGESISVSEAWISPPEDYDIFSIGEVTTVVKPFRVSRLGVASSNEISIEALEYNEEIYNAAGTVVDIPDYSNLPNPNAIPQDVINLTAHNSNAEYDTTVFLEWTIPPIDNEYGWWDHAEVYVSGDTSEPRSFNQIGTTKDSGFSVKGLFPGKRYYFRVVSVSTHGKRTSLDTAPEVSIITKTSPPPRVQGLEILNQGNNYTFEDNNIILVWRRHSPLAIDSLIDENNGSGFGPLPVTFQDYVISVWTTIGGVPKCLRVEHAGGPTYVYTYQMNLADGGPFRHVSFTVQERDIFNQVSKYPATLFAYNPQVGKVTGVNAEVRYQDITLTWNDLHDLDLAGYEVRCSLSSADPWESMTRYYRGRSNSFTIKPLAGQPVQTTLYIRVASYDTFDDDDVNPSNQVSATTVAITSAMVASSVSTHGTVITSWDDPGVEGLVAWNSTAQKIGLYSDGGWKYDGYVP